MSCFQGGAKVRPKVANRVAQRLSALSGKEDLRRIVRSVPNIKRQTIFRYFIQKDMACRSLLATNHQSRIDNDAREPCREGRSSQEVLDVDKCSHEGILNRIFSVFSVSRYAESRFEQSLRMRRAESLKAGRVAASRSCHET